MDFFVIVHSSGSYFSGFIEGPSHLISTWTDVTNPAIFGYICIFRGRIEAETALKDITSKAQIRPITLPQFDHG